MKSSRIWELDALRGVCILGVIVVHFVYDLKELYAIFSFEYPALFAFVMQWGSVLFLLISGICVTLGHHPVKRGLVVFGGGMLITAVTVGMYLLGLQGPGIIIRFGILHCLGICMLLWPLMERLPNPVLVILGAVLLGLGYWFRTFYIDAVWLFPIGLMAPAFSSADYFPLMPHLGWFLLGAVLGRTAYKEKASLLPKVNPKNPLVRFFSFCGRQSLLIYLLHQPILSGLLELWLLLRK